MSEAFLAQLESRLQLPGLATQLHQALAHAADPERALRLAGDVLAAAGDDSRLRDVWARRQSALARILARLGGAAPFLMPFLVRYPEWLLQLAEDDLSVPRTPATYQTRLAAAVAGVAATAREGVLRRFKYAELARITVRELSAELVPADDGVTILGELSHLADTLLSGALACAAARVEATLGPPHWRTAAGEETLTFCILALGKLGGEELNYSSDVDLVYIFQPPSGSGAEGGDPVWADGPRGLAPTEYFTRLAQELGRVVTETTADGFLYRVDLDLRPEGSQGPLVISSDLLATYYELWAATWERAAFMKARPVAGDLALGWRTIRAIDPIIYRSATDYAGVTAIRALKTKVEEATTGTGAAGANVKTGPGGIRDVEFIAQALQLLHGGRMPQVRGRSTLGTLQALAEVGVLPRHDAADLVAGYRFLRRVEHRLQMEAERQVYTLPADAAAHARVARAMGFASIATLDDALAAHRRRIRELFTAFCPTEGSESILDLFVRNAPYLLRSPATVRLVEDLAAHLGREIAQSADPQRALNNLERFIRGVGRRRFYYELLLDRPELVPRLIALFASSEYLSAYFASSPRLIEPIFSDPNVLLLTRDQLRAEFGAIRTELARDEERDDVERELAALRLFHHRALVNVGLLDLGNKVTLAQVERALTDIAEACTTQALVLAEAELAKRRAAPPVVERGGFLVVAMGKLASRELMYGSDLDVIFLYDVPGGDAGALIEAQEHYVRLAQKLIWALQTRTREGICYEIDARLRPSGNQGMLVTSLGGFEQYHAELAQVWERQALLRARTVAGDARIGAAFDALRLRILRRPLPRDAGAEIQRVRLRMEQELARETKSRHDFKAGRGGLLDVESVVQFLQLQHGADYPELLEVETIGTQLARLARLGLLAAADADTLQQGWEFLQRLSSRLRIVENRSISDLDEERGDLDALARRLGYTAQRETGARRALLEDYRRHTTAIRTVYLRALSGRGESG